MNFFTMRKFCSLNQRESEKVNPRPVRKQPQHTHLRKSLFRKRNFSKAVRKGQMAQLVKGGKDSNRRFTKDL